MRRSKRKRSLGWSAGSLGKWRTLPLCVALLGSSVQLLYAQNATQDVKQKDLSRQIQELTNAMARTQEQLTQSQRQLDEMRRQLIELERQLAQSRGVAATPLPSTAPLPPLPSAPQALSPPDTAAALSAAIQQIRERQEMQESQIATHEQTKVESESKYPVKITGLVLLNAFVNTAAVDLPATPTVAISGPGSTGASLRQTVLGFDAQGPHIFGARSFADLRVDFDGSAQSGNMATSYSGPFAANGTLLRLRTAHAALQWSNAELYFSLDRPIFSPNAPSSLTAVAEPALAWSGNLWTWNPQLGATWDLGFSGTHDFRLQAALIDVGNAPLSPTISTSPTPIQTPPNDAEQSQWPGVEARIALLGSKPETGGSAFGVGGYFAPHRSSLGYKFDAWAGTLDGRLRLPARFQFTGSFYRGLALGGLGGGAYKDFAYYFDPDENVYYFRSLDDVGGWAQLKEKFSERVEVNAAFGLDNVFAGELRPFAAPGGNIYQNLARNRTYTGNVIYSPSAFLLFSLEYRHLQSFPVVGASAASNVIGLGAGYRF